MHRSRRKILMELMVRPCVRQFNIEDETRHIQVLIEDGLIYYDDGYHLTDEGKAYVSKLDGLSMVQVKSPLSCVAILVWKEGNILMLERKKEPFLGFYGLIGGKIGFDEYILEAAKKELKEESGLEADMVLRGLFCTKTFKQEKQIHSHQIFIVEGIDPKGELKDSDEGDCHWIDPDDVDRLMVFPDVQDLIRMKEGFTFLEMDRFMSEDQFTGIKRRMVKRF